jgi:anti-anti-sigma factor
MLPQHSSVQGQAGTRVGQYILHLSGPITHSTVPAIEEALRSVTASSLIVDLTEVPYIDSAAVGVLMQAYVSCQRAGRNLALVGLGHRVKALLQITRIDLLFTTFPTRAEAEAALA